MRVPIPDRKGVLAEITTLATELDVSIADIEIAHSTEGRRGRADPAGRGRAGGAARRRLGRGAGYRPSLRSLRMTGDRVGSSPSAGPVDARSPIPGSKSITNRALVCAALADGTSTLDGALFADDTEAMIDCLQRLGVGRGRPSATRVASRSRVRRDSSPRVRSSWTHACAGTTARFLLPVLAIGVGPVPARRAAAAARPADGGRRRDCSESSVREVDGRRRRTPARAGRGRRFDRRAGATSPASVSSQFLSGCCWPRRAWPGGRHGERRRASSSRGPTST